MRHGACRGEFAGLRPAVNSRLKIPVAGEFARFASRRIAAKGRGGSKTSSFRFFIVSLECSNRGASVSELTLSQDLRTLKPKPLDPRLRHSGTTKWTWFFRFSRPFDYCLTTFDYRLTALTIASPSLHATDFVAVSRGLSLPHFTIFNIWETHPNIKINAAV